MKKLTIFLLLLLISCGPSEEEIQARIDDAVEQATSSTTTSTSSTTTSNPATTTNISPTTVLDNYIFYEDSYEKEFFFLLDSSDYLINSSDHYLRFRATWNSVRSVLLHFSNLGEICSSYKQPYLNGNKSYIAVLINSDIKNCMNSKELIAIEIRGENIINNLVFYNNSTYSDYFDSNYLNKPIEFICCHQIDFLELNSLFKDLKNLYKNPSTTTTSTTTTSTTSTSTTTTSTTTTSTTSTSTTTTTTTTSTTTTTLFIDNEAPTWPNKEVTIANINPTYFEVLWNTASDNVNVAGYKFYLNNQLKGEYVRNNDNNSIFLDGLTSGTTYNLEIVAYDDAGNISTDNPIATIETTKNIAKTYIGLDSSGNYQGILLNEFKVNFQNISRNNFYRNDLFYINYIPGTYKLSKFSIGFKDQNNQDYTCLLDLTIFDSSTNYSGNVGCDVSWNNENNMPYINVANGITGNYKIRILVIEYEYFDNFNLVQKVQTVYSNDMEPPGEFKVWCNAFQPNAYCQYLGGQKNVINRKYFEYYQFNLTD